MKLVNIRSLGDTLDRVNDVFFFDKPISKAEKMEVSKWIAGRQGMPRSYANMFAGTNIDLDDGFKVFTGERMTSASARHIIGEEACRTLILLNVPNRNVRDSLEEATAGMMSRISGTRRKTGPRYGLYCCGKCSVGFWRHLLVGGLDDPEGRLQAGVRELKKHRKGDGKWWRFPFYYTLLALDEMDFPAAIKEMKYAAPVLERLLKRSASDDKYNQRRYVLAERILANC